MKVFVRPLAILTAVVLFFGGLLMPVSVGAQAESFAVMTLANGTQISMTQAQLAELITQPGISFSTTAVVTEAQMAVPLPASLGGGYVVAEPAALAAAMNSVGVSSGLMATSFAGATVGAGTITVGAAAGAAMTAGVGAGTIAVGAVAAAAAVGGGAAAFGSGGGGGGGGGATTTTHTTTSHH
jgi:hypothetical protein